MYIAAAGTNTFWQRMGMVPGKMTIQGGFIFIGVFILLVVLLVYVIPAIRNKSKFAKLPALNSPVKVADKRVKMPETIYYVTFELADGRKIKFDLSEKQYKAIPEGACGILTYKETDNKKKDQFLGFKAEAAKQAEPPAQTRQSAPAGQDGQA